jgi:predicted molibdopterin-dependent oxidoreductase YjgC
VPRRGRPVTSPIIKKPGQPGGFVPIPYPNALDLAARRLAAIRAEHGEASVGLVGSGRAAAAITVETQVVHLAGSTLGGMVRLLVESGQIDVQVVADGVAELPDTPLRRIADRSELLRAIASGELKGLVSICFDPPGAARLADALGELEFHLAIDTVLGPVARRADIVLPLGAPAAGGERDEQLID